MNMLPYCLLQMEDDAIGGWIVLNRHYKPLGGDRKTWYVYQEVPASARIKEITPEQHDLLSWEEVEMLNVDEENHVIRHGMIWLYNDGCLPHHDWDAYVKRLEVLRDLPTMG